VRIGPEDALLHVSQIMDDFITYDEKHGYSLGVKVIEPRKRGIWSEDE